MIYFCAQKNRRAAVLASAALNGIDYVEVVGPPGCGTQLHVVFLKDARRLELSATNVALSGDTALKVTTVTPPSEAAPLLLTVQLDVTGDFAPYTLALVAEPGVPDPPDGLDPALSNVDFSFKIGCPTPADCKPSECCPPARHLVPDINYLAKDYEGFRQVMLDRIAVLAPTWRETHAADLGVALVETLAYLADHLSYQQDAVSTEAYVGTARSRISLRRHARLVDYHVREGANARTWVYVELSPDHIQVAVPKGTLFYVRNPGLPVAVSAPGPIATQLASSTQPIFKSLEDAVLHFEQNQMELYTWGDANCCLPAGATSATLVGNLTSLAPGTVLVFEEFVGPKTGNTEDADPSRRWAVRLTRVRTTDYKGRLLSDPLSLSPLSPTVITHVEWAAADALPFPLCLSSTTDAEHHALPVTGVSVCRGNIIPADHGTIVDAERLDGVPVAPPAPASASSCECNSSSLTISARPRYYPQLARGPLTFKAAYDPTIAASGFLSPDSSTVTAQICLQGDDGIDWSVTTDLLSSDAADTHFVPEIERDGSVFLRFGDGVYGRAPSAGQSFTCTYRIGNGTVGNIGRDTLAHVVSDHAEFDSKAIRTVRNPLPASGGIDPETMEHIRQWAPFAFQTQERCVTEGDYGVMATRPGIIQQARGTLRWTGSWHTAFVSVDPVAALTPALLRDTERRMNLLRMMGTDLAVEGAVIVGLRIQLQICVDPDHFAGDVYSALMKVFITGDQCSGKAGLLNAANFSFGASVYASPLIAAAQAIEGVRSASLTRFTRMDDASLDGVTNGFLTVGRLELPRCDNDPNHLDRGLFELRLDGGK
jgi:hypothetical protein